MENKNEKLEMSRHSLAHILAKALLELYPDTKLTIGPAIEDGFYYDIDTNENLTPDHFEAIEKKMREILNRGENFVRKGDQVYVEGRIHYSQYQDKNTNETRYSTEIVVDELRKLGRKSDSGSLLENNQQAAQPQPTAAQIVAEVQAEYPSQDAPEEELPF